MVVQQYIYSRSWTTLSFDDGRLSGRCRDFYRLFCLLVFFFFFLFSRLCLKVVKDFSNNCPPTFSISFQFSYCYRFGSKSERCCWTFPFLFYFFFFSLFRPFDFIIPRLECFPNAAKMDFQYAYGPLCRSIDPVKLRWTGNAPLILLRLCDPIFILFDSRPRSSAGGSKLQTFPKGTTYFTD